MRLPAILVPRPSGLYGVFCKGSNAGQAGSPGPRFRELPSLSICRAGDRSRRWSPSRDESRSAARSAPPGSFRASLQADLEACDRPLMA